LREATVSSVLIPERLADNCTTAEQREWLARLPDAIAAAAASWALELAPPFDGPDVSAAWVSRARRRDGTSCVLKIAMPHMEGAHEAAGLQHWNGDPTIRLLDADSTGGVMLLEACEPGTSLRSRPDHQQDAVIASLLRRAWQRALPIAHPFRPLRTMLDYWAAATRRVEPRPTDSGLARAGLELFDELGQPAAGDVLLMTDLHAGNVLAAKREPWLAIDPKPFVGDAAYDATQHLLNCRARVLAKPATIDRFAELLDVDARRVSAWLFARAASEPCESRDAKTQMQALAETLSVRIR
jgi:streptomycin 6-kinase